MAGRQPAPLQAGEGSSRSESSFLDHFLRRPLESSDPESAAAAVSGSLPSPSNSIAALVSNYDDLSGANPWQYVSMSGPSSPTSQRDYYNQHSSLFPSSHFQRDLVAEYPWMQEVLEQQRAANFQLVDSARSKALEDVDWQRSSRGTMGHYNHTAPAGNSTRRRREQANNPAASCAPDVQAEAFWYEEAAAAWYRNGGYLRSDGEGLNGNLARLDSSGTQSSDSASAAVPQFDNVDVTRNELARMRWERREMPSPSGMRREGGEMDAGALPRPSRAPPLVADAGVPGGSTQSTNSPETSLSSETGGGESHDEEEECTKSIDPLGSVGGEGDCSTGKRKTSEASGEDGDDSARISSEAELKRTTSSGPRKRLANAKLKPREPRYAIKTRTDVDIMDDGFKWRKYGQKAVKNSPHPRNYYRCTTPHCPVRKRVERSHEDSGLVITTYEGRHTHLTPGFHRPAVNSSAVYSGERPRSGGLFQNPALGLGRSLLPLPPEFSQLAALHQMRALRSLQTLAQHQSNGLPPGLLPGSLQRDSLLRAQHFLGLHDAAFGAGTSTSAFGSVKQEPFPFTGHDFMTSRSSHGLPYPGRPFPPPGLFLDRMQQIMRAAQGAPRHLRPMQSDLDSFPDFPSTDSDLVRRVLEAEEQDQLSGGADGPNSSEGHDIANVDSPTFNYGGAAAAAPPPPVSPQNFASSLRSRVELERLRALQRSPSSGPPRASLRRSKAGGSSDNLVAQCRQQPPREPDALLNGLLQEMVDQPGDR